MLYFVLLSETRECVVEHVKWTLLSLSIFVIEHRNYHEFTNITKVYSSSTRGVIHSSNMLQAAHSVKFQVSSPGIGRSSVEV